MSERPDLSPVEDSLDLVELDMALEAALPHLTPDQREEMARDILARRARGEECRGGGDDDDALSALARRRGPRGPNAQSGAASTHSEDPC